VPKTRNQFLGNVQGCLGRVWCTVQDQKIVLLRDLERLLNAAILLNGDVRLNTPLEAAAPPMKTGGLGNVQVGNLHLLVLRRELPGNQPGNRAFPDPAFLRHNAEDHRHRVPSYVHASMLACGHAITRLL
jgi:hypothetical protein